MLKWTASTQRLNELPAPELRAARRQRRQRRATIANKENVPSVGYTSTPMPLARQRNSPLVLAPLTDIRNVTPESSPAAGRRVVQSVRHYAATLPRYEEEYSPSAGALPSGQHLALRGLLPLDPFLEQPRYMAATQQLRQRKLEADFVATMELPGEQAPQATQPAAAAATPAQPAQSAQSALRAVTPQPSTHMGDQTLDKLIDAILDSACKADAGSKKKPRKSFNLRRRTLVKQQLETQCVAMLSPSYAPGDDPASDLSFTLLPLPLPATPEPASPLSQLPHSVLLQLPTPQPRAPTPANHSDTFCLATPVRPLKRNRARQTQPAPAAGGLETPPKRYKVDARNYFEVGLALPSIYV
ncbi:uncharacterized protein [Drosophila virilis]|uniref:Uncharacterized protein n=1 Tax=Drosophila virilis TaxID=7244 RepID=B4M6P2_DROVI|nr:uncharacterized protein LOC6633871 [Drosophila virilis]EDW62459.1 uncharacterized protein Dvir_GJ16821 [Drosophila virilis]